MRRWLFSTLFLWGLFSSVCLLALDKKQKEDRRDSSKFLTLRYTYAPHWPRRGQLKILVAQDSLRCDSFWKSLQGERHDIFVIYPKEGVAQGERYRDGYSLLFWEPLQRGAHLTIALEEDAEPFPGFPLFWALIPESMLRLAQKWEKKSPLHWKGKWGKLEWEARWRRQGELKTFVLRNPVTQRAYQWEVLRWKKLGGCSVPTLLSLRFHKEKEQKITTLRLFSHSLKPFRREELSLDRNPQLAVVDFQLEQPTVYRKLLEKDPQNGRLWYSLARAYLENKMFHEAERALRQTLVWKPQAGMVYMDLVALLVQQNRRKQLWATLFLARQNGLAETYKLYFWAAKYAQSQKLRFKLLRRGLNSCPVAPRELRALWELAGLERAEHYLLRALQKEPLHKGLHKLIEEVFQDLSPEDLEGRKWTRRWYYTFESLKKRYPQEKFFERIFQKLPSY